MSRPRRQPIDFSFSGALNAPVAVPLVHNGNIEAVYDAIARGNEEVPAIVRATGLDENAIRTSIRRLHDKKRIRRMNEGGYRVVVPQCLLAEVWR